ncbi:hypothetical protein XENOCAPTIV_019297 [Xenoophorus captivus]|uniref:Uncharacterized protein n=1 Tax=Xenoophorus captivus TaxID=1517983 RepID=A0ABV0QN53_9TELE
MASRKRVIDPALSTDEEFKTPEKRVSVVRGSQPDSDFMRWGVEETCQYLQREGLGEWKDTFRGVSVTVCGSCTASANCGRLKQNSAR